MSSGRDPSIGSVLHPTDFSQASASAYHHALRVALGLKSYLDILHVGASGPEGAIWADFPKVRQSLADWDLLAEDSPKGDVEAKLGIKVRKVQILEDDPAEAMLDYLDDVHVNIIVLSTRGHAGPPRWLEPSISERLSRESSTITLFVPEGARGFVDGDTGRVGLKRILLPVDRTPHPQLAIETAGILLEALGAEDAMIDVLHVGGKETLPALDAPRDWGGGFRITLHQGKPVDTILAAQQSAKAELIVMATEGHHGFLDAFRGSTTERIVRQADCPVLAVPPLGG